MDTKWKMRLQKFWRDIGKPFLVILVVVGSFRSAVADWNDVPTGSMKPAILEGERIFVNKLAYDLRVPFTGWRVLEWAEPQRGDVVIFFSPGDDTRMVKRVVGVPGDRIEMTNNHLLVNGQPADYAPLDPTGVDVMDITSPSRHHFVTERIGTRTYPIMTTPTQPARRTFGTLTVPRDEYFLMGDNRDNSRDSRWFGFVERSRIVGRATAVVVSLDPDHYYFPRWNRFFHSLP